MITIGICDDEEKQRQIIRQLCERFFKEYEERYGREHEHEILEFSSGEEVLAYGNTNQKLQLLFLDVEMGELSGIELLRKIEDEDWIWRTVFVSNHEDAIWEALGIKTLDFGRKPVTYLQIEKWINTAIRENIKNVVIEYMEGTQCGYTAVEDVFCLEAAGNYTYLWKRKDKLLVNHNLTKWQMKVEKLPMLRIHKSYIINMQHVKSWEAGRVVLTNGTEYAVGRTYAKKAKERYLDFVKKQALGRM